MRGGSITSTGKTVAKNEWLKAHVMIGTTTNVVTSVEVTPGKGKGTGDIGHLPALLGSTAKRFAVKTVSGDRAYMGHYNLDAIDKAGAFPLIPFKSSHRAYGTYEAGAASRALWQRAYAFFTHNREEFLKHYHQRSNVETTFHMIKAKFGHRVRSKSPVAQTNEVLAKVLCHNLCCLVSAFFELGVEATFWQSKSA